MIFGAEGEKELPDSWTGRTTFELLRPPPPAGYSYVEGRLTKTQETTRPGNVWPEVWRTMSQKQKQKARSSRAEVNKRREEGRNARGIKNIPDEEVDAYTKVLSETRQKLALPDAPAMPVTSRGETLIAGAGPPNGSDPAAAKKESKLRGGNPLLEQNRNGPFLRGGTHC